MAVILRPLFQEMEPNLSQKLKAPSLKVTEQYIEYEGMSSVPADTLTNPCHSPKINLDIDLKTENMQNLQSSGNTDTNLSTKIFRKFTQHLIETIIFIDV